MSQSYILYIGNTSDGISVTAGINDSNIPMEIP